MDEYERENYVDGSRRPTDSDGDTSSPPSTPSDCSHASSSSVSSGTPSSSSSSSGSEDDNQPRRELPVGVQASLDLLEDQLRAEISDLQEGTEHALEANIDQEFKRMHRSKLRRRDTERAERVNADALRKLLAESTILRHETSVLESLYDAMPRAHSLSSWQLAYASTEHGLSLRTLLDRILASAPTLVFVEDTKGARFGGFAMAPWPRKPFQRDDEYVGTSHSFVFQVIDSLRTDYHENSQGQLAEVRESVRCVSVFGASGLNSCFQLNSLSLGLSMGANMRTLTSGVAWQLEPDLSRGASTFCETFANPPLASGEQFEVAALEVWTMTRE